MGTSFRHAGATGLVAALLLLCGCAGAPERPVAAGAAGAAAVFPQAFYDAPPAPGRVFRLDPERSQLQVLVFRAGALARQGHNHLIRAGALEGAVFLADELERSRLDLHVPVAGLEVDPAAERTRAGAAFAAPVDEEAQRGTRRNLLGERVLDAAAHPVVAVSATVAAGELPWLVLDLSLTVRGHAHAVSLPVRVETDGATLRARGLLALRHADLGLEPFRALGGLLAVADPLLLHFDLVGEAQPFRAQ